MLSTFNRKDEAYWYTCSMVCLCVCLLVRSVSPAINGLTNHDAVWVMDSWGERNRVLWLKWLHVVSLALTSTMLILFYLRPLRKTSPNYRKHRTSLPVSSSILLNLAVHVLSSSSSTGSPLNTLTSK